jgi:hypothetical protein
MIPIPKEHGAYSQMALPLATSLIVAGLQAPSALLATSVVAGFLAHEPMLIVLGHRGRRVRQEQGTRALSWLVALATLTLATGIAGMAMSTPVARALAAVPLVPAAVLFAEAWRGREKSARAQVSAALAFSLAALPICAAGGVDTPVAAVIAAAFAVNFVLSTLAVRVVILRVRGGGDARATAATRRLVFGIAAATAAIVAAATILGALHAAWLLAFVPSLAAGVRLAQSPPPPARLRTVGWTLAATSAGTAVAVLALL